jgi:hypothetical protein
MTPSREVTPSRLALKRRVHPRETVNCLAQILYKEMEFLGPSSPEPLVEWDKLTQWQRSLCVNCVERLLEEGELIERARQFTDHNVVLRTADE